MENLLEEAEELKKHRYSVVIYFGLSQEKHFDPSHTTVRKQVTSRRKDMNNYNIT